MNIKVERLYALGSDAPLKALVDISLDDIFIIKGVRVVEGKNGLFVSMPQELGKDSRWYNRVQIIDEAHKEKLSQVVLTAYNE